MAEDVIWMEDVVLCPGIGGMYAVRNSPRRSGRKAVQRTWSIFWCNGGFICEFFAGEIFSSRYHKNGTNYIEHYKMCEGTKVDNACRYIWLKLQDNKAFPQTKKRIKITCKNTGDFALPVYGGGYGQTCHDSEYAVFNKRGATIGIIEMQPAKSSIGHPTMLYGFWTDYDPKMWSGWDNVEGIKTIVTINDRIAIAKAAKFSVKKLMELLPIEYV